MQKLFGAMVFLSIDGAGAFEGNGIESEALRSFQCGAVSRHTKDEAVSRAMSLVVKFGAGV